ncbi:hypothetical protein V2J09_008283 [Rumex salicifolius]
MRSLKSWLVILAEFVGGRLRLDLEKMFDLNIDVCAENLANKNNTASGDTEASGTSESSVVNVDEGPATVVAGDGGGDDRDSDNSMSALNFDVFRKLRTSTVEVVPDEDENDVDEVAGNQGPSDFVTWKLFPVKVYPGGGGQGVGMSYESQFRVGSSDTQWLNLSVSGSASGSGALEQPEIKVPPPQQQQVRRSRRGPRSRSSQYRGVTFYRRTGRWESHIWDCGKQVYLGGFDTAYAAARAYDRAAIKFRGVDADINFAICDYDEDMKQMKNLTKEEFVQTLRRQSTGFPRGSSRYRGVALQKYGRWEAQTPTGQYLGNKAYPIGREAVIKFQPSNYEMKMPVHAGIGEHGHNLDLNLGMSVSADVPRGKNNVGDVNPHLPFYHGRRPMVGSSYWLPNGQAFCDQPLPSSQSVVWPGAPAGVPTTHVERGTQEKKLDIVPSSRLPNRAWNVQGGANQVVPLFSTAASSGFSF